MPAGSAYASLMMASDCDAPELDWGSTPTDVPTPEAPEDPEPGLWDLISGLASSMQSNGNSTNTHITNCYFMTDRCFVPEQQGNELYLIEFQFVPEAKPDARDKPPKSLAV